MAVGSILKPSGDLMCEWQDKDHKPHSHPFAADTLERWEDYIRREDAVHRRAMQDAHAHDD